MKPSAFARLIAVLAGVLLVTAGCGLFGVDDDDDGRPSVFVDAEPDEGPAPLTVNFSALPRDDLGEFVTWKWFFDDGSSSSEQNPDHVYDEPGEYEVLVRLTDSNDDEFDYNVFVVVTAPEEGAADFDAWLSAVNAACATTTEQADAVPGDPNSPEVIQEFVTINNAETEAIEAAGVPQERRSEATEWLELRNTGSQLFLDLAENPPTSADDPRPAELQAVGQELSALSAELGLIDCVGDQ